MSSPSSYAWVTLPQFSRSMKKTSRVPSALRFLEHFYVPPLFKSRRLRCALFTRRPHVFSYCIPSQVDVDQALAGIDKLLRSQELTFAFVGVAPALSLVYVMGGYLGRLYAGVSSHGRLGGKRRRMAAWSAMRRIERLLIMQPRAQHGLGHHTQVVEHPEGRKGALPHLTAGLLLLSVSSLRQYAETWLPPRSRLREGFLEDVGDLEDPGLGREEKMLVVEKMWRSWAHALGWHRTLAAEVSSSS
jgi:nuclear control of ATPase protein 2